MDRKVLTDVFCVFWSAGKSDPPTLSAMRAALAANGFSEECAPEVPQTTAFRRVLVNKEGKQPDGSTIRACFKENGRLRGQLDRLYMPSGSEKIEHEPIAGWSMDKDGSIEPAINGSEPISQQVNAAKFQYTWADVSGVFKKVLKIHGNGAYPMRDAVYCVPTKNTGELLSGVEAAASTVGLRVTCCTIPDTGSGRAEVTDAIVATYTAECDEHQKSVESYTAEKSKAGVVENRKEAIATTKANVQKLTEYIGEQAAAALVTRLDELTVKADAAIVKINAYKPAAKARRVVTTGGQTTS